MDAKDREVVTKAERDAQSVLIDEQRRLLAEKQTEIGALEAERDDLRKIVEMVHADLGIQRGDHVGEAISELKKEASDATARQRMTEVRALKYSAQAEDARREIERLRSEVESLRAKLNAKTVEWPEWANGDKLWRTTEGSIAPIGTLGRVLVVWSDAYQVELRKGFSTMWAFDDCTPCDPPPEASHITPEGKQTAEGALPQPGDTVRLVRFPTPKEWDKHGKHREWRDEFGKIGELAIVMSNDDEPCSLCVGVVRAEGLCMDWPLSCIEVVKGGDR